MCPSGRFPLSLSRASWLCPVPVGGWSCGDRVAPGGALLVRTLRRSRVAPPSSGGEAAPGSACTRHGLTGRGLHRDQVPPCLVLLLAVKLLSRSLSAEVIFPDLLGVRFHHFMFASWSFQFHVFSFLSQKNKRKKERRKTAQASLDDSLCLPSPRAGNF